MLRLVRTLVLAGLITTPIPATARADADPASDMLVGASVFYPYSPPVSGRLQKLLNEETTAASQAHFPIKVALIGSPTDLGAVTEVFGKPQQYANFLDQEISTRHRHARLLVVMPDGYGTQGMPRAAAAVAAELPKPAAAQSNDLARAAIVAIQRLAAAAGHPIRHVSLASGPISSGGSGPTFLPPLLLALGAVVLAGAIVGVRRRRALRNR